MFEVIEIMKEPEYEGRIFPAIIEYGIYDPLIRAEYMFQIILNLLLHKSYLHIIVLNIMYYFLFILTSISYSLNHHTFEYVSNSNCKNTIL